MPRKWEEREGKTFLLKAFLARRFCANPRCIYFFLPPSHAVGRETLGFRPQRPLPKSAELAAEYKKAGNALFKEKDYFNAREAYTRSVISRIFFLKKDKFNVSDDDWLKKEILSRKVLKTSIRRYWQMDFPPFDAIF